MKDLKVTSNDRIRVCQEDVLCSNVIHITLNDNTSEKQNQDRTPTILINAVATQPYAKLVLHCTHSLRIHISEIPGKPELRRRTRSWSSIGNRARCFRYDLGHSWIGRGSVAITRCGIQWRRVQERGICIADAGVRTRSGGARSSGIAGRKDSSLGDLVIAYAILEKRLG